MKLFLTLILVAGLFAASDAALFCDLCHKVVGYLETEFNKNEGPMEKDANKICRAISFNNNSIDTFCKALLDGTIDKIEQGIKNGQDATAICREIHFC